ncbi:glutathione hydrolase 1 proenzyme [Patella vulgata]|uniref:glutathione hydrolase 1 proenzyme n=1 Tax=Patella vulgata TaxID=6465 RepID=UPI00217FF4E5|nr:glutathione hydrolase 1 proenzyme [Patella vulgata]
MSDIENEVFEKENETNKNSLLSSPNTVPNGSEIPRKKKKWSKKRSIIILIILIVMIVWLLAIGIGVGFGLPELLEEKTKPLDQNETVRLGARSGNGNTGGLTINISHANQSDVEINREIVSVRDHIEKTTELLKFQSTTRDPVDAERTKLEKELERKLKRKNGVDLTYVEDTTKAGLNTTVESRVQVTTQSISYISTEPTSVKVTTELKLNETKIVDKTVDETTKSKLQKAGVTDQTTLEDISEPEINSTTDFPSKRKKTVRLVTVGAVAADHAKCSDIGRDILDIGGSAVDAAIATLLCNGIMQPHSMGIGGGCFMVLYDQQRQSADVINGREVAPKAATFNKYTNKSPLFGPLSIAVPGEVKAYWAAHQKYGKIPWKDLFAPSIKMARDGAPLSASAARGLRFIRNRLAKNLNTTLNESYPELCKIYCDENGKILKENSTIYRRTFAETLQGLAEEGPEYLYSGEGARKLIKDIKQFNGILTMDDLKNYKLKDTQAISYQYGNITLHTLGAPSGGPVMGLILKIMEGFNFTADDLSSLDKKAAMYHKMIESFKFVYADRLKLADPLFVNLENLMNKMVSPEYADFLREQIDTSFTHNTTYYTNLTSGNWDSYGTTHISIIGPDGDAVAVTSTINYYFGSLLYSPSTGIILNNEMADFSFPDKTVLDQLKSQTSNYVAPGKTPLSSMCPAIFVDNNGEAVLVMGSSGGARITTVNAQVAARILWLDQSVKEAIQTLRFHHQLFPNHVIFEQKFSKDVMNLLHNQYGHKYTERTTYMAVVQGVARDPITREIHAFSDERKHGKASLLQRNITVVN